LPFALNEAIVETLFSCLRNHKGAPGNVRKYLTSRCFADGAAVAASRPNIRSVGRTSAPVWTFWRPKIMNERAGLAGRDPIERELLDGDQILYRMLDFGILRVACELSDAIGSRVGPAGYDPGMMAASRNRRLVRAITRA